MRRYFTGLVPFPEEVSRGSETYAGAGSCAQVERSDPKLRRSSRDRKEIVIYARSFDRAQAALSLVLDAFTVIEGVNSWSDEFVAIPADKAERANRVRNPHDLGHCLSTASLWEACELASIASRRRKFAYALSLYRLSTHIHGNLWEDLDPARFPYQHRSSSLRDQVRFSYAIVTAYAVVETLGCALHENAFRSGKWIPEKRNELESRLTSFGVNLKDPLIWQVRGQRTKLEAKRPIPAVRSTPWFRHPIRDQETDIVEAIAYVRWLRACAGAHNVTKMAYGLSVHDVANAQSLARRLLSSMLRPKEPKKARPKRKE